MTTLTTTSLLPSCLSVHVQDKHVISSEQYDANVSVSLICSKASQERKKPLGKIHWNALEILKGNYCTGRKKLLAQNWPLSHKQQGQEGLLSKSKVGFSRERMSKAKRLGIKGILTHVTVPLLKAGQGDKVNRLGESC